MKNLFVFIMSFFLFSCIKSQNREKGIELKISNKEIKNGDFVNIEFTNNTNKVYYLPIDFTDFLFEINMLSNKEQKLFFLNEKVVDSNGGDVDMLGEITTTHYVNDLYSDWNKHLSQKRISDIIIVKPKEKKMFSFPFYIIKNSKYYEFEWFKYNFTHKENFLYYIYQGNMIDLEQSLFSKSLLDSLETLGYKLYEKEIISNKVPIILEK